MHACGNTNLNVCLTERLKENIILSLLWTDVLLYRVSQMQIQQLDTPPSLFDRL
jgi:hypothetical protein